MQIDQDVLSNLKEKLEGKKFALDFETYGTQWMRAGFWVRCCSFHNDDVSICVEIADQEGRYLPFALELFEWLSTQTGMIAHNASYEIGVIYSMTDVMPEPHACTYALLGALNNEGSPGSSWALKAAGPELLGWEKWDKQIGPKSEMAKIDFETLGWYCQLDSAATWAIYQMCCDCVDEYMDSWGQHFWQWYREDMTNILMLQQEAYVQAIYVDTPYISQYSNKVDKEIEDALKGFYEHPDLLEHINAFNSHTIGIVQAEVDNYGSKYKKDGSITINYQKALDRLDEVKGKQHFNIGSTGHLKWLLYDRLQVDCKFFTESGAPAMDGDALEAIPKYGRLVINYRDAENKRRFLQALQDNSEDGRVRVSIKIPGTYTGRMSAGSLE